MNFMKKFDIKIIFSNQKFKVPDYQVLKIVIHFSN